MSLLLQRIDALLSEANDEAQSAELLARRAAYMARIGDFAGARQVVAEVRSAFSSGQSARVSILVMIAEGLIETFEGLSPQGKDRIERAFLLASAFKLQDLIALSSAWRAYWQFEMSDFPGMARSALLAITSASSSDHEARSRAYMTIGNALHSCGERDRAVRAYTHARHYALDAGDRATIEAIMFNRAAFALAWLRARACFGESDPALLALVDRELQSSSSYQNICGISSLDSLVRLWRARLQLLKGNFAAAEHGLRAARLLKPFSETSFDQAMIDLELSYCVMRQGRREEVAIEPIGASRPDLSRLHSDEQLVAAWLRHQLALSDGRFGPQVDLESELGLLKERFQSSVESLSESLAAVPDELLDRPIPSPKATN